MRFRLQNRQLHELRYSTQLDPFFRDEGGVRKGASLYTISRNRERTIFTEKQKKFFRWHFFSCLFSLSLFGTFSLSRWVFPFPPFPYLERERGGGRGWVCFPSAEIGGGVWKLRWWGGCIRGRKRRPGKRVG